MTTWQPWARLPQFRNHWFGRMFQINVVSI